MGKTLLEVQDLSVSFRMYDRGLSQYELNVISDLSVTVHEGEIMVIVGASGSGKSVLAHAVLGILPSNAVIGGSMHYDGAPLTDAVRKEKVGSEIIMIPQSVNYLDPLMKVGKQVRGVHGTKERQQAAFRRYGLKDSVAEMYPFQLSGGMTRRVLISYQTHPFADPTHIDIDILGLLDAGILHPEHARSLPENPSGAPSQVTDAWFSNEYLNLLVNFTGKEADKHTFSAAYTVDEKSLTFRLGHDDTQDTEAGKETMTPACSEAASRSRMAIGSMLSRLSCSCSV